MDESLQIERSLSNIFSSEEVYCTRRNKQEKLFEKCDDALHMAGLGEQLLTDDRVAPVVADSIRYHDTEWFDTVVFCIMPNHVHLVLTPKEKTETTDYSLAEIMHNIKRNSAKRANETLCRTGNFWQHENYDHIIRDEMEMIRVVKYVLHNPVKAGLVDEWTKWKWSFCKYEI